MKEGELDAIIFDYDGVLSQTLPRQYQWFKHWAGAHEKTLPFDDFNHFLRVYNETLFGSGDIMGGVQKFYDDLELPCAMKDDKHPVWIAYDKFKIENPVGLYEGTKEVLDQIFMMGSLTGDSDTPRRLRMCINTTNSWKGIWKELQRAGVLHYFDSQIGAEMLDRYHGFGDGNAIKKPSKLSVALSLDNLGTEGRRTMHVGDTRSDLLASKQVVRSGYGPHNTEDLLMVGAAWGYEGREKLEQGAILTNGERVHFDHIIDQPENLIELVNKYRSID